MTLAMTSPAQAPATSKWRRLLLRLLMALLAILVLLIGAFTAWFFYARDTANLVTTLQQLEAGNIPEPSATFKESIAIALNEKPLTPTLPGVYTFLQETGGVTYNAVIVLGADGRYQHALTVGNERVHKMFKHTGRWWMQGRVFHAVLIDGDRFLVPPSARDGKTPSLYLMSSKDTKTLTLQGTNGEPITYQRDESVQ